MSQLRDERLVTPPPSGAASAKRHSLDQSDLLKTPARTIERPKTPARKTKQEFVFELWSLLAAKLEPMLVHARKQLRDQVSSTEPTAAEPGSVHSTSEDRLDFMALTAFVRQPAVMECASRFWAVLTSFVRCRRLQKGKMKAEMKEARIILTSLVMILFPQDTLDIADVNDMSDDPLSEAVYRSAKDVIQDVFEEAPRTLDAASKLQCDRAAKSIEDFLSAFESWRHKDKTKMLQSLQNYYEEWVRSRQVLKSTSMNELQRNAVLETVECSIENTRKRISRVVGAEQCAKLCSEIEQRIASEEPHIHAPHHAKGSAAAAGGAPTPLPTPADSFIIDRSRLASAPSTGQQLRAYGIPAKLKSGIASPSASLASASQSLEPTLASAGSAVRIDDGRMVLDLNPIIAEEAAKKYWADFSGEIEAGKFHRLFELLSEMLARLKKASPGRDGAYLDDLVDVDFLRQSIEHGTIDAMGFYGIFDALWTQMSRLHAPAFDTDWKQWHDKVVADMAKPDASWTTLLPDVLNKLLCKLDQIEDAIAAMQPYLKESSKHKKPSSSD